MGAPTDNRKRLSVDLCPFSPSSPHLVFPISKRHCLLKSPSPPPLPPPFTPPTETLPHPRCLPPAISHPRRPVHGPVHIIRAFRPGSWPSRNPNHTQSLGTGDATREMGAVISLLRKRSRQSISAPDLPSPSNGPVYAESLELEQYKQLVDLTKEKAQLRPYSPPQPSDLTVATRNDDKSSPSSGGVVVSRTVKDARCAVKNTLVDDKRVPHYLELLEESKKRDPTLSSLDFQVKLTEKKITGLRSVSEQRRAKPQKDIHGLFAPLNQEEENEVSQAMSPGHSGEILVAHEASNIEITRNILHCLSSRAWLNDEVINLYLELLKEREKREPKKFLKCHFFNTFFYKKLIGGKNGYDFKSVRRWTTQRKLGYGLIECEKVFVPIHKDIHWCLAVIDVKEEKFQYLDSLGGLDHDVLRILARYFMDELKDKSDKHIETSSWRQETVADLPMQRNGYDCGMFMLKYIDFYSRGLHLSFGQENMVYFRKRTAKEILRLRAE